MGADTFTIRGGNLVSSHGIHQADVSVVDGLIAEIGPDLASSGVDVDVTGRYVLPGVIDCHVHFNDPGRAHWEGWPTGSAGAAIGGTTSVIDMPFNSLPPTVDKGAFKAKLEAADGRTYVDFALFGGLHGGNLNNLEELSDLGVAGFKAFMCDTGLQEFPGVTEAELLAGMELCAQIGRPVLVHAETEPHQRQQPIAEGLISQVRTYLSDRPVETETEAVRSVIGMAEVTGARVHVVHVSTAASAELIGDAQARGIDISAETCPHYLTFTSLDVEHIGAAAKCAPPIRSEGNRNELWRYLDRGVLTMIGSDHSPAGPAEKLDLPFADAWGGIAGCQSLLASVLTEGVFGQRIMLERLPSLLAQSAANRFGLPGKSAFEVGADADIVVLDLDGNFTLTREMLRYRHTMSPYVGRTFQGMIDHTWRRGRPVVTSGRLRDDARDGQFLKTAPGSEKLK